MRQVGCLVQMVARVADGVDKWSFVRLTYADGWHSEVIEYLVFISMGGFAALIAYGAMALNLRPPGTLVWHRSALPPSDALVLFPDCCTRLSSHCSVTALLNCMNGTTRQEPPQHGWDQVYLLLWQWVSA